MDRESEIGMGHVLLTHSRQTAVDFSKTAYTLEIKLMTSKPKPLNTALNLLKPFQPQLWIILIGTLVLTMLSLVMIKIMGNDKDLSTGESFQQGCLDIFARFCGQGNMLAIHT